MNSEDYRKILKNTLHRAWMIQSIESLTSRIEMMEQIKTDLQNPEFYESATIEELYDLRGRLLQVKVFANSLSDRIEESELLFSGEFEDKQMSLAEIGIQHENFICTKAYIDPISDLKIDVGTVIRIEKLSYANVSNTVTAYYRKLVTSDTRKKLIEVFEEEKQSTLINLKILGENFKPL